MIEGGFVPIVWADTTVENLLTKFKLIMSPELKKMTDMQPEERLPYIMEHLANTREKTRPLYMENLQFTDKAKQLIDQKNSTGKDKPFDYDRVQEMGYFGKFVEEEVNLDEPLDQDDLLRTYGLAKVFLMAARKAAPAGSSGADQRGQ